MAVNLIVRDCVILSSNGVAIPRLVMMPLQTKVLIPLKVMVHANIDPA